MHLYGKYMLKQREEFLMNPKYGFLLRLSYDFFWENDCVIVFFSTSIKSHYQNNFGPDKSVRMVPKSQQEVFFFQDATESLSVITSA